MEHVTFAHGALDRVGRLPSVELRPGDAVAMEDPEYHHLLDLGTALGLRMVPVAVDDEGVLPEAVREALRAGARAFVCSPRVQNPYPDVLVVENDHASDVDDAPCRR